MPSETKFRRHQAIKSNPAASSSDIQIMLALFSTYLHCRYKPINQLAHTVGKLVGKARQRRTGLNLIHYIMQRQKSCHTAWVAESKSKAV
ncbi:hypothetical protein [Neisseria elongata]|uniref:hypothetical protein n=1 Tax=Neisseria elongata TaxID=495 RepID=UPI0028D5925D|nr:hypothetical protein [Neisseria elongata]